MNEVIVIGDVFWDNFLMIDEKRAHLHCQKKDESCEICFKYGQKIPIEQAYQAPGGNAANISVGLARLGIKCSIISSISTNKIDQRILQELKDIGVGTNLIIKSNKLENNFSTILVYKGERTILTHHQPTSYSVKNIPESHWVYLTSMGSGSEETYSDILKGIKQTQAGLIFQPGTYQLQLSIHTLKPIIQKSKIFIANLEEYQELLDCPNKNVYILFKKMSEYCSGILVLTDHLNGAYAWQNNIHYFIPAWSGRKLIEPTGAGDAFSAAFIAALIDFNDIQKALKWGIINSGRVVESIGAQTGLLSREEIKHLEKKSGIPSPIITPSNNY